MSLTSMARLGLLRWRVWGCLKLLLGLLACSAEAGSGAPGAPLPGRLVGGKP